MKRWIFATALIVSCFGCESAPRDGAEDTTTLDPAFQTAEVVDIAVLPPSLESPDRDPLQGRIRSTAHEYLIAAKNYAVPDEAYVDVALQQLGGDGTRAAGATGSDGALAIVITQWETEDLLPKGRIYVGGTATLYGNGNVLWERRFRNKLVLAPKIVTASNRAEITDGLARDLTRDLLSTLPPKIAR